MVKSTGRRATRQGAATTTTGPLHGRSAAGLLSTIAAGANLWAGRFLASLHETRRRQAIEIINRYQHLIPGAGDGAQRS
jgi:hypothetical protein